MTALFPDALESLPLFPGQDDFLHCHSRVCNGGFFLFGTRSSAGSLFLMIELLFLIRERSPSLENLLTQRRRLPRLLPGADSPRSRRFSPGRKTATFLSGLLERRMNPVSFV